MDVICIPDAEWDASLWTNRQHSMSRLAARGDTRVLYVAPPRFALSRLLGRRRLRRGVRGAKRHGLFTRRVSERLWVQQPLLPLPNRLARRWMPGVLDRFTVWLTKRASRRLGFAETVIWSYTPLATAFHGRLGERLLCYDVVDDYPSQPNYRALGAAIAAQDETLTRAADLVFTTSELLQAERSRLNSNCHLLGNAADVELFSQARAPGAKPAALDNLEGPILGFHGSITGYKLDLELIRSLAQRRRDWQVVLVGPWRDDGFHSALEAMPNVHLVGFRPPEELPDFLRHFDIGVIPYRRTRYTERLSALKVRECLAAGLPIVATALPGFEELGEFIGLADDSEEFEQQIELTLKTPPAPIETSHSVLADYTWDAKVDRARQLIEKTLSAQGRQGSPTGA